MHVRENPGQKTSTERPACERGEKQNWEQEEQERKRRRERRENRRDTTRGNSGKDKNRECGETKREFGIGNSKEREERGDKVANERQYFQLDRETVDILREECVWAVRL
ncbi:hypothetical protein TGME49_324200 [Toxoplasma gondii ME49]|uniref:Uncharacterized protein n=1 Tax=Toxoplasma gondii (strain ATCC 50611 / Me49) TaxID=508771 RepID=S8G8A1_TOXGM|nr:hypothetical protein TGME49_324200 [Toxoplasma gondii ME49]EPT24479.1 hypothetical protein TGME49_324200 [Toxoplasma gondii ME49]|eukprot:XP_018634718.1 hypothetical protein TGME49_324200 [Toxoplasma gondii ME49]